MPTTPPATKSELPGFLAPADRRRMYIHDTSVMNDPGYVCSYLRAQHFFPERALWLSEPQDVVLLARPLEAAYLEYMRTLGAGPRETLVTPYDKDTGSTQAILAKPNWATQLQDWAQSASTPIEVNPFCTTEDTQKLTEMLKRYVANILPGHGDTEATYRANHKSVVRAALKDLNLPEIPGCVVSTKGLDLSAAFERVRQAVAAVDKQYRQVIVRADYASGGAGNIMLDASNCACLEDWLAQHMDSRNFLVEAYLPWRSSPNVQYWIAPDGTAKFIQITDQRMNGTASYIGNCYPAATHADPELRRQTQIIIAWLASIGVRGVVGIDFIDTYGAGIRFVEVNARVNGSTYASATWLRINHLRTSRGLAPLEAWQMTRGVPTALPHFAAIQAVAEDLLYDHGRDAGVIPYWTGAMQHGIFSCVTLGADADQVQALETAFLRRVCDQ